MCDCVYENSQLVGGEVIDADEDLVALCNRMKEENNRRCAILFCDVEPTLTRH